MGVRTRSRSDGALPAASRRPRQAVAVAVRVAAMVVVTVVVTVVVVALCVLAGVPARATPQAPWTWPLAGQPPLARAFAPPPSPWASGHRGVDLAASPGAQVLAAGAGRVSYAGPLAGRGVVVVVHGELRTTYEPLTPAVEVGQQVVLGQALGRLAAGHAGCARRSCLHWGLRRGDAYLDPLSLVGAGPVRLLPLLGGDIGGPGGGAGAEPGPVATPPGPAQRPAPALRLRSAASPSGLLALLALLAGLALLRPRRPPAGPGGVAPVIDLRRERVRRRAG